MENKCSKPFFGEPNTREKQLAAEWLGNWQANCDGIAQPERIKFDDFDRRPS